MFIENINKLWLFYLPLFILTSNSTIFSQSIEKDYRTQSNYSNRKKRRFSKKFLKNRPHTSKDAKEQTIQAIFLGFMPVLAVVVVLIIIQIRRNSNPGKNDKEPEIPKQPAPSHQGPTNNNIEEDGKIINAGSNIEIKLNSNLSEDNSKLLNIVIKKQYLLDQLGLGYFKRNDGTFNRKFKNIEFTVTVDDKSDLQIGFNPSVMQLLRLIDIQKEKDSDSLTMPLGVFRKNQGKTIKKDNITTNNLKVDFRIRQLYNRNREINENRDNIFAGRYGVDTRFKYNKIYSIEFNDTNSAIVQHIEKVENATKQANLAQNKPCIKCSQEYSDKDNQCPSCKTPNVNRDCGLCLMPIRESFDTEPDYEACIFPCQGKDLFCKDCIIDKDHAGHLRFKEALKGNSHTIKCPVCREELPAQYEVVGNETDQLIEALILKKEA